MITFFSKRQINFKNAFISMFLLLIGNVLSVLLKLLNCQNIGNGTYHFYFAYENCYGSTWWISLFVLFVIIFIFLSIFIILWRMTPSYRQEETHSLSSFVSKYKPQYFYWEFVIFIRRICIAMFSASVTNDNLQVLFLIVMAIFLYLQTQCEPFIIQTANTMEWILLFCIIFIIALNLAIYVDDTLKEYLISFLIIFPFLLFIYFLIHYKIPKSKAKKGDMDEILLHEKSKFSMSMNNVNSNYDQLIEDDKIDPTEELLLINKSGN